MSVTFLRGGVAKCNAGPLARSGRAATDAEPPAGKMDGLERWVSTA